MGITVRHEVDLELLQEGQQLRQQAAAGVEVQPQLPQEAPTASTTTPEEVKLQFFLAMSSNDTSRYTRTRQIRPGLLTRVKYAR